MKMKKLFAGLVATSIVAAGTSAFAAPIANDAGFDKEAGTYSIVSDLSGYGSDQMTIIIIPEAAYNAGTINDADILYIDQAAADTNGIFANVGILGGTTLADGTYYAKIGGENIAADGIIVEKFTITKQEDTDTYTITWGDITCDGVINLTDALSALYSAAGTNLEYESTELGMTVKVNSPVGPITWGDITCDGVINLTDALSALYSAAGTNLEYESTELGTTVKVNSPVTFEM